MELQALSIAEPPTVRRGRGRPPGSKNKKATPEPPTPTPPPTVRAITPEAPAPAPIITEPEPPPATLGAVEQARTTFQAGNRLAALVGFALGGFVPLASFTLIHFETATHPLLWILVTGGLVYSALSVYGWACEAFQFKAKAIGFVILLEGTMSFSGVHWLSLAGLAILIAVNGVTAAVSLQSNKAG